MGRLEPEMGWAMLPHRTIFTPIPINPLNAILAMKYNDTI